MSDLPFSAFHVVGLFTAGLGAIFFLTDREGRASRALALCFAALGIRLWLAPLELGRAVIVVTALTAVLEALTILAAMEWARRVADTVRPGLARAARGVLRAAQILVLVYAGLSLGYLALDPADATSDVDGFFRVRALEWAVFAPVLGTAVLLSTIGILLVLFGRGDPAENIRLRALMAASPFLFAGLVVHPSAVPLLIAAGLVIFLYGAVRYLQVLARRGRVMSQFLAPEVAKLVRLQGAERVLQRERRVLTALFCDLRGFTAYSAAREPQALVALLERYYAAVGEAARAEGATVKDHAGDGVLLLFGAPVAQPDHAARAVRLARALQAALSPWLTEHELGLGIGIASGEATVGAIQGAGRLEYVAVGPVINLAARLCQSAAAGEVLLDDATRNALADPSADCTPREALQLKGLEEPVVPYALRR